MMDFFEEIDLDDFLIELESDVVVEYIEEILCFRGKLSLCVVK